MEPSTNISIDFFTELEEFLQSEEIWFQEIQKYLESSNDSYII